MRDLSLHLLDILTNSIAAEAQLIQINVYLDESDDLLSMTITDDGFGMDEAFLETVTDPFSTTRTTRKVGLGIPLLKELCELTGGSFSIESQKNMGTQVCARFVYSSIDRLPLGNMGESMAPIISSYPEREFVLMFSSDLRGQSVVDTREIKAQLGEVPLSHPDVYLFLSQYIFEQQMTIIGGK